MTIKQIEEVFLSDDVNVEEVGLFQEAFDELKREQSAHLNEALSVFHNEN